MKKIRNKNQNQRKRRKRKKSNRKRKLFTSKERVHDDELLCYKINKHSIFLSLKRVAAFFIDFVIACFLVLLVEVPICLLLGFFTNFDSSVPDTPFLSILGDLHLILIPTCLGITTSLLLKGESLGMRLMGIKLISTSLLSLSIIGCIVRSFIFFSPPYLFYWMVIIPLSKSLPVGTSIIPSPEFAIFIFLLLIVPCSIIAGGGHWGYHDLLMKTVVIRSKSNLVPIYFTNFKKEIYTLLSLVVFSYCIQYSVIHLPHIKKYTLYAKSVESKLLNKFRHNKPDTQNLKNLLDQATADLSVGNNFFGKTAGYTMSLIDDSNKSFMLIPEFVLYSNGKGSRNTKYLAFAISKKIRDQNKSIDKYIVKVIRVVKFDLFHFVYGAECEFLKVDYSCKDIYIAGLSLISWHTGIYSYH